MSRLDEAREYNQQGLHALDEANEKAMAAVKHAHAGIALAWFAAAELALKLSAAEDLEDRRVLLKEAQFSPGAHRKLQEARNRLEAAEDDVPGR